MICYARLHNTIYAYRRLGCRCAPAVNAIRAAWRLRAARYRPHRKRKTGMGKVREEEMTYRLNFTCEAKKKGRKNAAIANTLGVNVRTVMRYVQKLKLEGKL